tara:strand:+ start:961 stop:1296 length:336 start_codon:yes stop_codon:yes gene_type:complete
MKEIKFNKNQTPDQIMIEVSLPNRIYASEPVVNFSNSEMIEYLKQQHIDISEYELSKSPEYTLTSKADKRNDPRLQGTWIFKKKENKVQPQKKMNKRKAQAYNKGEDKPRG